MRENNVQKNRPPLDNCNTLFASQAKQSGEPFPIHMLPSPIAIKKDDLGDVQLMEHFVKSPSYGVDSAAYLRVRRSIGKWIAADCLPYRTVQTMSFRFMTRSLDPKSPDFGRKVITAEVGNLLCKCCFLVSSCVVLVSFFHCIVLFFFLPLYLLLLKFDLFCDSAVIYCRFLDLCIV